MRNPHFQYFILHPFSGNDCGTRLTALRYSGIGPKFTHLNWHRLTRLTAGHYPTYDRKTSAECHTEALLGSFGIQGLLSYGIATVLLIRDPQLQLPNG